MRKFLITGILAMALAAQAHAGPFKPIKALGKEIGRSGRDFITFKRPVYTIAVLAQIGADLADAQTSRDAQRRGAHEENSGLYGLHPSYHRIMLTDGAFSFGIAIVGHSLAELGDRWDIHPDGQFGAAAPQIVDSIFHIQAAVHNVGVCSPIICKQ